MREGLPRMCAGLPAHGCLDATGAGAAVTAPDTAVVEQVTARAWTVRLERRPARSLRHASFRAPLALRVRLAAVLFRRWVCCGG
jgi:hypothetical protein